MATAREIQTAGLGSRIEALPGFATVRDAASRAGVNAYLVGGAIRDALLGADRADLDVVVDGDHQALLEALGGEVQIHDRFETARMRGEHGTIDVAQARTETYPHPGALPEVRAAGIDADLARRDFTINALAVPIAEPSRLIDPRGGLADLRSGLLRFLHPQSFVDDPTRALRAARYASRLDLTVEDETMTALRRTDLSTISAERRQAELRRLAADRRPRRGFELLDAWGLLSLPKGAEELIDGLDELLATPPWSEVASRADAILVAVAKVPPAALEVVRATPSKASEIVATAQGRSGIELALARALGAEWLDRYVRELRDIRPAITGDDLLAAGVSQGPAIGRGLEAAMRAKLDGEATTRERELEIALEAARA